MIQEAQAAGLDVSAITDYLFISAWPNGDHADEIEALGVQLILSMHWIRPSRMLGKPPVELLWLPTFDFPLLPMPMRTLRRGVEAALPVIESGGRVLSHCRAGVHRSVAMACCVLIGKGHTADQAMALVKKQRAVADPDVGYIQARIRKFERVWNAES